MSDTPSDVVVFRVIGELRGDPGHLLLTSPDGRWYDYDIARGTVAPIEPIEASDLDRWDIGGDGPQAASPKVVA